MDQRWLPVCRQALQQREHASLAATFHGRGRRLADDRFFGTRSAGVCDTDEARVDIARWNAAPSDFLLDPDGVVGHLYDAKATPHMVVIDRKGVLVYIGAIDDKPSVDVADVKIAKNYVVAALDELAANKPVTISATHSYGCSVKYKTS
jgi:hypothetical protein